MARFGSGSNPTAASFLAEARRFIGDPYVFGAAGPKAFDCSGLVQYALLRVGVRNVPRTSEAQWAWVQRISASQLQPGDLIFEQWPGDQAAPGHVVIYTGNGKIEQAPQTGELVQTDSFSPGVVSRAGGRIVGYGRIPGLTYSGSAASTGGGGSSGSGAGGGGGATPAQVDAFLTSTSPSGGVLADAGALLHGTAVVLDRIFGLFAPGQGWRIVFGATAVLLLFASYRAFGGGVLLG